jgi:hypothetical protein
MGRTARPPSRCGRSRGASSRGTQPSADNLLAHTSRVTYAFWFIGGLKEQTGNWHRMFTRRTPQLLRSGTDARHAELGGEDHGGTADARRGPGAIRFAAGWPHRTRRSLRPHAPTDYPQPVTRQSRSAAWPATTLGALGAPWERGALSPAKDSALAPTARWTI